MKNPWIGTKQANAAVREFSEAVEDHQLSLMCRIYLANPDLRAIFDAIYEAYQAKTHPLNRGEA